MGGSGIGAGVGADMGAFLRRLVGQGAVGGRQRAIKGGGKGALGSAARSAARSAATGGAPGPPSFRVSQARALLLPPPAGARRPMAKGVGASGRRSNSAARSSRAWASGGKANCPGAAGASGSKGAAAALGATGSGTCAGVSAVGGAVLGTGLFSGAQGNCGSGRWGELVEKKSEGRFSGSAADKMGAPEFLTVGNLARIVRGRPINRAESDFF